MQKTFNLGNMKYKVLISRNKKVNITTGTEEINFYMGNPRYVNAEKEYLNNFLSARLMDIRARQIETYILNNI
jgi:hypothetical protein